MNTGRPDSRTVRRRVGSLESAWSRSGAVGRQGLPGNVRWVAVRDQSSCYGVRLDHKGVLFDTFCPWTVRESTHVVLIREFLVNTELAKYHHAPARLKIAIAFIDFESRVLVMHRRIPLAAAADQEHDGMADELVVDREHHDLGAFLGPIQNGAKKTERMARQRINTLVGDDDFVFTSTIRSAQSIAAYCRLHGMLTNEYEQIAADTKANRRWYRLSKEEREKAKDEHTFSEAAPGLATDWENLVAEIMARFQTRLRGEEPQRVGMSTGA